MANLTHLSLLKIWLSKGNSRGMIHSIVQDCTNVGWAKCLSPFGYREPWNISNWFHVMAGHWDNPPRLSFPQRQNREDYTYSNFTLGRNLSWGLNPHKRVNYFFVVPDPRHMANLTHLSLLKIWLSTGNSRGMIHSIVQDCINVGLGDARKKWLHIEMGNG